MNILQHENTHPGSAVTPSAEKRFFTVVEAALYVEAHPETVRRALRAGEMHGSQRGKGGTWKIRPVCAEAWADGVDCPHEAGKRPVSLADFRARAVNS